MTAIAGALLGTIITHIAEKQARQPITTIISSTLGFSIGVGYEAMLQSSSRSGK